VACDGHVSVIEKLLSEKSCPIPSLWVYRKLLHVAIFSNHESTVNFLLGAGAAVNYEDTYIYVMAEDAYDRRPSIVMTKRSSTDSPGLKTPLFTACFHERTTIGHMLVEAGADVNYQRTSDGSTALMACCKAG
jgi:hypothetical protein